MTWVWVVVSIPLLWNLCRTLKVEVAGVTFSDSDSAPVPKCLNLGQEIFYIWEIDSCSDSGYHRSNPEFTHVFTWEMTVQTPTAKVKKWLWIQVRFFPNFWLRASGGLRRVLTGLQPGAPKILGDQLEVVSRCSVLTHWNCFVDIKVVDYLARGLADTKHLVACPKV